MGTPHVGRGASPLEKDEQKPRCGGRKSARAWLGGTKKKSFLWWEVRKQEEECGCGLPGEGERPRSIPRL